MSKVKKEKNPLAWPIGIMVTYAVFMLFLFGYLAFARSQRVDLVASDYYQQEIAYQQQIDRLERTSALAHKPTIEYEPVTGVVTLRFPENIEPAQVQGRLTLFRPSNAALDITTPIHLNTAGEQVIRTQKLRKGLWRVKLLWRLNGLEYYVEDVLEVS